MSQPESKLHQEEYTITNPDAEEVPGIAPDELSHAFDEKHEEEKFHAELSTESGNEIRETGNAELDSLLDGVNRLGALGTMYWGNADGPLTRQEEAKDPFQEDGPAVPYGAASPHIEIYDNVCTLTYTEGASQKVEVKAGYYRQGTETVEAIPFSENDGNWKISGNPESLQTAGQTVWGLAAATISVNPFADSGFDLESFINANTSLAGWSMDNGGVGVMERQFSINGDASSARIDIEWSMSMQEETGGNSATLAVLFKIGADGELIYVTHKTLEFGEAGDPDGSPAASGNVSWNVEPGEKYLTSLMVVNQGHGSGAILSLDGMEYAHVGEPVWVEPVYEDVPGYVLSASGNVIGGQLEGNGDSHQQNPELAVSRFLLNGQWHEADGNAVRWTGEDKVEYVFQLDAGGRYSLEACGPGQTPPSFDHLNIVYEVKTPGGFSDEASLFFRAPDDIFTAEDADNGIIFGSSGDDPIYGVDDDIIYYTGQNDATNGGTGLDLFSWHNEYSVEGLNTVRDFSFADNDKLSFEGLLEGPEDLGALLDSGALAITTEGDTVRLSIINDSDSPLNLDVNIRGGELETYRNGYVQEHGSTDGMELALLQLMLANG